MSLTDRAPSILVVEDDDATRTFLADNLTADGFELLVAARAADALALLETKFPDLVVVDVGLPDACGLRIVEKIRASDGVASRIDPAVAILVLSGRAGELDRLRGFERGCDDYLVKPFSYAELRFRVQALLRRSQLRRRPSRVRVGELEIDAVARVVRLRGTIVDLAQKEFALLRALASDPTRVFTKDELLRSIWGYKSLGTTRTLDSHACRLRHKLGRHGDRFVVNVWGVGYRLVDGPLVAAPEADDLGVEPEQHVAPGGSPGPAAAPAVAAPQAVAPAAVVAAPALIAMVGPEESALLGWALAFVALAMAAAFRIALYRRGELVIRACHELRGPLTAARLALHAGARDAAGRPARLAAIDAELRRAGLALEDLAAARRGRRAADRAEPVDVGELLTRQAPAWRAVAAAHGSDVALGGGCAGATVRGDRVRLAQAVGNLVANALEHGAGSVEVRARPLGDRVRIEVADDGPGLPAPVAELARRARGGRGRRGRGLAIAAEIADRHGGRLLAAPSSRGARLALELPAWRGL